MTPGMGRFITPDRMPATSRPGEPNSWNKYAYAGGDPINNVDQNGTDYEDEAGDAFGSSAYGSNVGDDDVFSYATALNDAIADPTSPCYGGGINASDICQQWIIDESAPPDDPTPTAPMPAPPPPPPIVQTVNLGFGFGTGTLTFPGLDGIPILVLDDPAERAILVALCVANPEVCLAVGAGVAIYVAYQTLPGLITNLKERFSKGPPRRVSQAGQTRSLNKILDKYRQQCGGKTLSQPQQQRLHYAITNHQDYSDEEILEIIISLFGC